MIFLCSYEQWSVISFCMIKVQVVGGCKRAIDEFCDKENQLLVLMPDKSGSKFIRVQKT